MAAVRAGRCRCRRRVTRRRGDLSNADEVNSFLKKQHATFTNIHLKFDAESQGGLQKRLGYKGGIPHAALFDRTGKRVWTGHPGKPELEEMIESELSKPQ